MRLWMLVFLSLAGSLWAAPPFAVTMTNSMQWTNPTQNTDGTPASLAGINVYRAALCTGPWTLLPNMPVQGTTFTDMAPLSGGNCYEVTAVSTSGKESVPSNTLGFPVPNPPTGLH